MTRVSDEEPLMGWGQEQVKPMPKPGTMAYLMAMAKKAKVKDLPRDEVIEAVDNSTDQGQITTPQSVGIPQNDIATQSGGIPQSVAIETDSLASESGIPPQFGIPTKSGIAPQSGIHTHLEGIPQSDIPPQSSIPPQSVAIPQSDTPQRKAYVSVDDGEVYIKSNYMFFDKDIVSAIATMREAEAKVYLALVLQSYGKNPPRNICSVTNALLKKLTGLGSPSSFSKAFKGLESMGLIKRLVIGSPVTGKTMVRVYLPCETGRFESITELSNIR